MGHKPRTAAAPAVDPDLAGSPLEWADSIHGYLMLFPLADAWSWRGYGRGEPLQREPLIDGVVARSGAALVLECTSAKLVPTGSGVVAVLAPPGGGDELVAAALVDGEWESTGAHLEARGGSFVVFDGSVGWAMVEGGLYVAADAPDGRYRIDHRNLGRGHALRLSEI